MDPCEGNVSVYTNTENYLSARDQHNHKLPTSLNKPERELVSAFLNESLRRL